MKIAVIAANGRLGRMFVEEALKAGHTVRAGVRGDSTLKSHPSLEIVRCDATQIDEIKNLIKDQDCVVSCIGHVKGSPAKVQTIATKNIVAAMNEQKISRFVDVTGTGVRFPGDKITLIDRFLNFGIELIDPKRIDDGRRHQKVLQQSDLDWTTIRVLKLQNVPAKPFDLATAGPTKPYVGRREVARAMLKVIKDHSFLTQAPIITTISK